MTETTTLPVPAPSFEELAARVFGSPAPDYSEPRYLGAAPSILAAFDQIDADVAAAVAAAMEGHRNTEDAGRATTKATLDAYLRPAPTAVAEAPPVPAEPASPSVPSVTEPTPEPEPVHEPALDEMAAAPVPDDEHMTAFLELHEAEDARVDADAPAVLDASDVTAEASGEETP